MEVPFTEEKRGYGVMVDRCESALLGRDIKVRVTDPSMSCYQRERSPPLWLTLRSSLPYAR
ncbi:hypothetical protein AMK25_12610 [Micromonospora sp. TSRI0369]|nr:hypothetical protein AMK25_12610 [Micromonospora sp. TSRI0369]